MSFAAAQSPSAIQPAASPCDSFAARCSYSSRGERFSSMRATRAIGTVTFPLLTSIVTDVAVRSTMRPEILPAPWR